MRFTALILFLIAAMLISVSHTASPLAAQILTATPAAQSHDLYGDGHEETFSDLDQHRYSGYGNGNEISYGLPLGSKCEWDTQCESGNCDHMPGNPNICWP